MVIMKRKKSLDPQSSPSLETSGLRPPGASLSSMQQLSSDIVINDVVNDAKSASLKGNTGPETVKRKKKRTKQEKSQGA